jgi:hypothetical protein
MTEPTRNEISPPPKIDLRSLPSPWRYILALAVMAPIAWFAWHVGKDRPRPYWLEHWLIPFLAWCYIALGIRWVILTIIRWRRSNKP